MGVRYILFSISLAVFTGAFCWLLTWPLMSVAPRLRFKPAFPDLVLNGFAEHARLRLQRCEKHLYLLTYTAIITAAAFLLLWFFGRPAVRGWIAVLAFSIACMLAVAWVAFTVLQIRNWSDLRFTARADAVMGTALARLALQGQRVFHGMSVGDIRIDHVVAGPRGVFAVKVVARRVQNESGMVRLSERSLKFDDGTWLTDPLAEVELCARLLGKIVSRVAKHRLTVRPVLAVPGWNVAPVNDGDLLLLNEKNAVMLPGWSRPADHLMEQDIAELHERLVRLCVNRYW
ncbi:MAG: NERD domain-containing protein [Gammaproteobacteria bacterium]|nr:NERD domain-containing protein [Gammaproteobacteria bacterium]MDE2345921.1 NERD domain-containing protein [Gammaproteobacteria bacterium]